MENLPAYQSALNGVAFFVQRSAGYLRLSGVDRVDFIQRQSTNDLRQLTADQNVMTILTSPTARILDVCCLIDEGETLGVITLPGRQDETAQFLRSRIFFSDQVAVINVSSDYGQVLVVGPKAATTLQNLGIQPPRASSMLSVEIEGQSVIVCARKILSDGNYHLLVSRSSLEFVISVLAQAGAKSLDADTFEILRVEAGQPGPSGELNADYTPLEVGFHAMIAASKGCYTGQEIIARQITYDKVTKHLVGIKLDHWVDPGASLVMDEKSVGALTSVVDSPRFGVIGLGIIRRTFDEIGVALTVAGTAASVNAKLTGLPFA